MINLTQHVSTVLTVKEPSDKGKVKELLTFEHAPTEHEIQMRAQELAQIALSEQTPWDLEIQGPRQALIGGAPYLMAALERSLRLNKIEPLYAFTERQVEEVTNSDGSVTKKSVFVQTGWVSPPVPQFCARPHLQQNPD